MRPPTLLTAVHLVFISLVSYAANLLGQSTSAPPATSIIAPTALYQDAPAGAAILHAQSSPSPGPLHLRTENQEISDLLAPPPTGSKPVPNADYFRAIAVDPTNRDNTVLLLGQGFVFTPDNGAHWTNDFIPYLGKYDYSDPSDITPDKSQYAVGLSFDRLGHTYVVLQDPAGFNDGSIPNQVAVVEGFNHGAYLNNVPVVAATAFCGYDPHFCEEIYTGLGIVTDQSGTATDGTTWVYYLSNCQNYSEGCTGGYQAGNTVLFASSSPGAGKPFSSPYFISNVSTYVSVSGASAVVDSSGVPHFIYTDLGQQPTIDLVLDQASSPLVQYSLAGQNNTIFGGYPISGTPTCASHGLIAYCAFNAGGLGILAPQSHANVYLAAIDLTSRLATVSQVNNDSPSDGKDHFFPSVAVTPNGDVYVGFFDDRRDPANKKLDYFLARSTDGGKTFPKQQPINDASFPIFPGTPPQSYPGAFVGAIAAGPDGVIRAAYTDSIVRAGQTYFTTVRW